MLKTIILSASLLGFAASATAADNHSALSSAPAPEPFVKVSDALPLPDFIPGLGDLYVDPATLPGGPFLGYDRNGELAATIYMTPLADLEDGTSYDLDIGNHTVTSTNVHYNAGHPGVDEPHVHVVLYHADDAAERLAE